MEACEIVDGQKLRHCKFKGRGQHHPEPSSEKKEEFTCHLSLVNSKHSFLIVCHFFDVQTITSQIVIAGRSYRQRDFLRLRVVDLMLISKIRQKHVGRDNDEQAGLYLTLVYKDTVVELLGGI